MMTSSLCSTIASSGHATGAQPMSVSLSGTRRVVPNSQQDDTQLGTRRTSSIHATSANSLPPVFRSREPDMHHLFQEASDATSEYDGPPFQIHRKLLRRRHVRKEQIQRQRKEKAAKAAQLARDAEKRKRQRSNTASVATEQSAVDPSSPEGCNTPKSTAHNHGISTPPASSAPESPSTPTACRVPCFSPFRPRKRPFRAV